LASTADDKTVLILKYIIPDYTDYANFMWYGIANVAMNGGIMLSYVGLLYPLCLSDNQGYDPMGLSERLGRIRVPTYCLIANSSPSRHAYLTGKALACMHFENKTPLLLCEVSMLSILHQGPSASRLRSRAYAEASNERWGTSVCYGPRSMTSRGTVEMLRRFQKLHDQTDHYQQPRRVFSVPD
jgi:hypothetical protein